MLENMLLFRNLKMNAYMFSILILRVGVNLCIVSAHWWQ
jgi:hypothetical protein